MELQTLIIFFISSLLLGIMPGPDNIYVLSNSLLYGKKVGFSIVAGLCSGLIFHTCLVIFGVALLIKSNEFALIVLKFIGASYLLYLAWQIYKAPIVNKLSSNSIKIDFKKVYFKGVLMNATNPKVTLFFLAFLPQFVQNNSPLSPNLQMLILAILFLLATIIVFGLVVIFASLFSERLKTSGKLQKLFNKVVALIFLAIALKLLFSM